MHQTQAYFHSIGEFSGLTVYGHPASQPSRTVFWACLLHNLPFTLGSLGGAITSPEYRNPRGQVPSIVDDEFALAEACAIVCYLADKHGWEDLYTRDLQTRARIDQFLHMHHSLVRLATLKLMAPHVVKPLGDALSAGGNPLSILPNEMLATAFAADDPLTEGGKAAATIAGFLEEFYFNDDFPFVCNTAKASVADLVCYSELGQLPIANLFDFVAYPRIQRWLAEMKTVAHHDAVHAYNLHLGDIATTPNTMERFSAAAEAGFEALKATGLASWTDTNR
jgi:glutathione S-transferase